MRSGRATGLSPVHRPPACILQEFEKRQIRIGTHRLCKSHGHTPRPRVIVFDHHIHVEIIGVPVLVRKHNFASRAAGNRLRLRFSTIEGIHVSGESHGPHR